jgi:pimeloyl-ACP methyl ester carboxylesterase
VSPAPSDPLLAGTTSHRSWPWPRTHAFVVPYLAWDDETRREATIVLPADFGPGHHPGKLPLVISPHGRNNFGWDNAVHYWRDLPADGPFALVCPDGLCRAHDQASDPFDVPAVDPSLFTYGYPRWIDDLARMPKIVEETLPWVTLDRERVYVLGSSMGGQETLLLAARYPRSLSGGTGRLAGAAAFDSTCDLPVQCAYLTHLPITHVDPPGVAARMLEEVGSRPKDTAGFLRSGTFYNEKLGRHMTIGQLLSELPQKQAPWDERSPLTYVKTLARLRFPLRLYWSSHDVVVGNQATNQSGRLYRAIKKANPQARVVQVEGEWAHSAEFVPGAQLSDALEAFGLIGV